MNYFTLDYPNHTTLIMKSQLELGDILKRLNSTLAIRHHGDCYNPKGYLSLRPIFTPTEQQQRIAELFELTLVDG